MLALRQAQGERVAGGAWGAGGPPPPSRVRVREGGGARTRRAFLVDVARLGGWVAGLGLLAGCAPAPPPAAPAPARVYRVGVLATPVNAGSLGAFWGRMGELGYVEGQNLVKEERVSTELPAEQAGELGGLAAELVRLPVDVVVVTTTGAIRPAIAATTSIPIVMAGIEDPVESGFVESLARPGANVTGVAGVTAELDPKRLQLLVEAVPSVSKVAAFGLAAEPDGRLVSAATALGVGLLYLPVATPDGYGPAIERAVMEGADALLFQASAALGSLLQESAALGPDQHALVSLTNQYRLPAAYSNRTPVIAGGLMTYEATLPDIFRRAADYVDRILQGTRPADLPVELPTRYDLIVNLRTARALGLALSRDFLARVDDLIE